MRVRHDEVFHRSLAASGATLIALVGVVHEAAGHLIFPWGPAALGGPIGWHGLGLLGIAVGLGLLGGTLGIIRFPVVSQSLLVAVLALFVAVLTAIKHGDFHLFALIASAAGFVTAYCHRRAETEAATD